jgi:hypothetical protein
MGGTAGREDANNEEADWGVLALVVSLNRFRGAEDKVRLAVGGKSAVFYLPLSVTERLGYFQGRRLDVEISDVASGARALQAIIRRQRRDRHRHLRPRHPDAGQEPAGGGAAAVRPLPGLRAGDDEGQGRPLQIAEGFKG